MSGSVQISGFARVLMPASGPLPFGNQVGICAASLSIVSASALIAAVSGASFFSSSLMPLKALPIDL